MTAGFLNVASVTGTPPSGPNVSDNDSANVKVAPLKPAAIVKKAAHTVHHVKKAKKVQHVVKKEHKVKVKHVVKKVHKVKPKVVAHTLPKTTG